MYSIRFLGKLYKFENIKELSKKLNVSNEVARKLVNDILNKKHYRKIQGGSLMDIRKKPLLTQAFTNIKNKPKINLNKEIIKGGALFSPDYESSEDAIELIETLKDLDAGDVEINLEGMLEFQFLFSVDEKKVSYAFEYVGTAENFDLQDIALDLLQYYQWNINEISDIEILDVEVDVFNIDDDELDEEQVQALEDMELEQTNPINISTLYNEVYLNEGGDCIQRYLKKQYPSYSKKKIAELKTTKDIKNWCENYKIKMIGYDICGNVIASYYPEESKKKHRPTCVFIAYNNHLYPLKNCVLKKVRKPIKGYTHLEDTNETFNNLIKKKILPEKIYLNNHSHNKVSMFQYEGQLNLTNPDFKEAKDILEMYGLGDCVRPNSNLKNIGETIARLYTNESLLSFLPNNRRFVKGGYTYLKEEEIDLYENKDDYDEQLYDFMTIDKNKSYPYNLKSLDYLLTTDIRSHKHRKGKFLVKNLVPHFLYIVYPKESSILLPDANIYTGSHLKFCAKEGLSFEITEELETRKHPNYLRDFVGDMWNKVKMGKINERSFKFIMNVYIGKMEKNREYEKKIVVEKFSSLDECRKTEMRMIRYNDKYGFCISYDDLFCIKNMKPINIQIKDRSRVNLYNMLNKLQINPQDILQVKIDSITMRCDPLKREEIDKEIEYYGLNDIDGWKKEATNLLKKEVYMEEKTPTFIYSNNNNEYNTLGMCYAGCGKTYKIVNELLPKLHHKDYIVLSPSHSTLKEYKQLGLNAKVIQYYQFKDTIPDETNIIIDEFGMVGKSGLDMVYKCYLRGKHIWAYGDFNQLKSVEGDVYDKSLWLDLVFGNKDILTENRRNHFSKKYYDSLINSTNEKYLTEQIKKHSTKNIKDTELIIVYRNKTRKEYNERKIKELGFKCKTDIGVLLICINNDLRKKDLYNKFMVRVKSKDDDKIIVSDDITEYELTEDEINKNFDYGYARTIYSVQGESVKSYHYAKEDYDFIDGRTAYTIISRLKTK